MQGGYDGSASPGTIPKFSVQPQRFGPSPEKASSKRMHTAQPHSSQGGSVKRMQTAQPHSSQEEYEFNRKQEKTFDSLASMIYQTSVLFFFMFAVTCTEVIIKAHRLMSQLSRMLWITCSMPTFCTRLHRALAKS